MEIQRRSDLSEIFFYQASDFPMLIETGQMSDYPNCTALAHWHDDVELSLILEGRMKYNVNGRLLSLEEGEGVFINSRQMHGNFSENQEDCRYICLVVHPSLLCASSYVEQHYVAPLLKNDSLPYLQLKESVPWQGKILQSIADISQHKQDQTWALQAQYGFCRIWQELFENAAHLKEVPKAGNHHLTALKSMISFLQEHHQEKLTLTEIAGAGSVSKTTCCHIFEKYCSRSPVAYLIDFRLRKGVELLCKTDLTVTEICYEVGFSGASYFSESFRKEFGCSPSEFRKKNQAAQGGLAKPERLL